MLNKAQKTAVDTALKMVNCKMEQSGRPIGEATEKPVWVVKDEKGRIAKKFTQAATKEQLYINVFEKLVEVGAITAEIVEAPKKADKADKIVEAAKAVGWEVEVVAFTGMLIGKFPVVGESAKTLTVKTAKGVELVFDKKTKIQTNAKNPKFANKIK